MRQNSVATMQQSHEIPCLLLQLIDTTLLVPTVSVAEMAPMNPAREVPDAPTWLYGMYAWREIEVPLLSYESLNGMPTPSLNMSGRVAVFNNTGVNDKLPFIAIATQGIPRMARIGENDIVQDMERQKNPVDLMMVKVGMEEFVIPDITALETTYLNFWNQY